MKNTFLFLLVVIIVGFSFLARAQQSSRVHQLKATPATVAWGHYDPASKPVLIIDSGDVVEFETSLASAGSLELYGVPEKWIRPETRALDQVTDRGPGPHLLLGPIYINGAQPGDVLEVHILDLRAAEDFAINLFRPGGGTLPDAFPYQRMKLIPLDRRRNVALFSPDIEIPLRPFLGSMGVAPPHTVGRISSRPPGFHAGNLDNKELVAGSFLYIPVHVPGALFSFGDGHAGQGDGEVDGTAIEASLAGKLQLIVRKNLRLKWPRAETATHYMTMGFDTDLDEAVRLAVREMIDYLVQEQGLSPDDAYMLASMAVDVRVTQVVDGTKGAHAMLPKNIFLRKR